MWFHFTTLWVASHLIPIPLGSELYFNTVVSCPLQTVILNAPLGCAHLWKNLFPLLSSTQSKASITPNEGSLHGYTRVLPYHLPSTLLVHCSPPCTISHLPPSSAPSSFLLPQPDCCNILSFVIMSNIALSRAQLGCHGWCCCTRVRSWGLCIMQKNVSVHPAYPFLSMKSFHTLFPYSKELSLESRDSSKGIDHFKKYQGLVARIHNPIHTLPIIAGAPWH